ncbi:HAD family hydrolase [Bdellovibrio sp. NC01]|uniref:HAD family hydrolase n=1 Tax=Bdellovibrio sp. NC01 TaxID=2220073 RepID=UPI00115B630B|nr:HAD family hydrolase [Bdellovibrio sp. NC01]QDK38900.1 HAD family hydrolase [Bdellovibrio sp. NC01]
MLEALLVNIQNISAKGAKCLAVFDLDSTLFDVSPRLERILLDFAAEPEFQKRFPEQVALFKGIKTRHTDWGFTNALQRIGLDGKHPDFEEALHDYWYERFFSNEYLEFDHPSEGAVEFVKDVVEAGAEIAYLTGRDVQRMGPGSESVLRKWNFPINDRARLILKPHKSMDDAEFKTDWIVGEVNQNKFEKIYFFDNEPVILHRMNDKCPQVQIYFLDTTHSGKAHPPENLPRLLNFLRNPKGS